MSRWDLSRQGLSVWNPMYTKFTDPRLWMGDCRKQIA